MQVVIWIMLALASAASTGAYMLGRHEAQRACERGHAAAVTEQAKRVAVLTERYDAAAQRYEEWRAQHKDRVRVVTKEVERVIQVEPDWADAALPDSVRLAAVSAVAAARATYPGRAAPAVPAGPGLRAADQRGSLAWPSRPGGLGR